ncbi:MAG: hypothetical protein WBP12_05745 [Candidatus Saccharimonas sp.]
MVDTRKVRQSLKRLEVIKTWQLVVLLVLAGFVSATFLRLNNTGMIERRNAVYAADKTGNQDDITYRLYDLQRYTASHMNAETGVFYLQETYNRDVKELVAASSAESSSNQTVNDAAEAVCRPQFSSWSPAYVQCFVSELNKHSGPDTLPSVQLPTPALYRYSFMAPFWSPDFAGWSLLVCVILLIAIVTRLVSMIVLKIILKRRYREL